MATNKSFKPPKDSPKGGSYKGERTEGYSPRKLEEVGNINKYAATKEEFHKGTGSRN